MNTSFLSAILFGLTNSYPVVMAAAGGDGGDGSGGGDDGGDDLDPVILKNQLIEARRALENERKGRTQLVGETKSLKEKLASLGDIDPEEYVRLKTEADERAAEEERKRGNYEQTIKTMTDKHLSEKQSLETRAQAAERVANDLYADRILSRQFISADGNEELIELFSENIQKYYRVEIGEDGHRSIAFVDPATGGREPLKDKNFKLIEKPEEFINFIKTETKLGFYFSADSKARGTGVNNHNTSRSSGGKIRVNLNDPIEYGKYAKQLASGEAIGYEG